MKKQKLIISSISISLIIISILIISSCTKDKSNLNEQVNDSKEFSKELTIYDSSKKNSITLNVRSTELDILECYSKESFELIINPEKIDDVEEFVEDEELDETGANVLIGNSEPVLTIEIRNKNFQDNVVEYSLIDNNEAAELKSTEGCTWSGAIQIYDEDAVCVRTKNTSGKRCNDINFAIYYINDDVNPISIYSSTKKNGMTWTCLCDDPYNIGMIVSYSKQNKASFSTTWVYERTNSTYQAQCN